MVREYIANVMQGQDVRKNLIALKAACKDINGKHAVLYAMNRQWEQFYQLLKDEDPKIRKNVAQILGQLGVQDSLTHLYEAYKREETLFVRGSYLAAMKELDYRKYLEPLKERLEQLKNMAVPEESRKHIQEELRLLQDMIVTMEGYQKHSFTGWEEPSDVILMTNRNFRQVTADHLTDCETQMLHAGVQVHTEHLKEIYQIRTFSQLLFVLKDCRILKAGIPWETAKTKDMDLAAKQIAKQISDSSLLSFLEKRHQGKPPFYFRIECKSSMSLKQKSVFTRKLAFYLQQETEESLLNSTSHYEVELRLIENKSGDFHFLVKLFTYKDPRFSYRREAMSTSIQPPVAALVMELAKDYLKEGAQVLDPFCGVGTMLIERSRFCETGDLYGVDLFGKGIQAARRNTERAGLLVNYVNRDFFDFTHTYLFDEVVTNMPRVIGKKTKEEITRLYEKFWEKIQTHLVNGGILLMYSYDGDILRETILEEVFQMEEVFEISKKEGACCYVIRYTGPDGNR